MNKQPNSYFCFICGVKNINGVHVNFYEVPAQPPVPAPAAAKVTNGGEAQADTAAQVAQFPIEILARFTGQYEHQGYPGRMHGGVITGILDETIGRAINIGEGEHPMTWGVTAELTMRFRKPVPLGVELTTTGASHATSTRCLRAKASCTCPMGPSRRPLRESTCGSSLTPSPGLTRRSWGGGCTRIKSCPVDMLPYNGSGEPLELGSSAKWHASLARSSKKGSASAQFAARHRRGSQSTLPSGVGSLARYAPLNWPR